MLTLIGCLLLYMPLAMVASQGTWNFVQNGSTGVIATESVVVSDTLTILFDLARNNPLQINNHPAWGALWNMETNTASALDVVSDSFCASGGFLSNGTMVSVGGHQPFNIPYATDGRMGLRIFEPCTDPTGATCTLFEDQDRFHLVENRWYPSSARIFDGSLMVVGGTHVPVGFYNIDPVNNIEFFPKKDGGVPRPLSFLKRSLPANLYPRVFALPDGKVFMVANNRSIIYDIETNKETILPDLPNGVRVTNPFDGTATLLPLHPPKYIPEILVCGGTNSSDQTPPTQLSSQTPASDQCSRITLTPEGIRRGWEVERLLEPRIMPEMILMPNGKVLIINGGQTGYAAFATVRNPVGNNSNADHPAFTPSLYDPRAPLGRKISNRGMPTTNIARLYHSTVTLTPKGNILITGSNPNAAINNETLYHAEYRVEYLNPPYMTVTRPQLFKVPKKLAFNAEFTIEVTIPLGLDTKQSSIQVALIDLGFSSHAFHSSSRVVFMEASLGPNRRNGNRRTLTITSPPNNRVYPPGPGYIFVTVDDITSIGTRVMLGDGRAPPVEDQGV